MMTSSDDVIKWELFPRYWPFVRGIHRSPLNSPHKGQWRGALMFSLIWPWINGWVNNREAGDLRHHHAHYDVSVMAREGMPCGRNVSFCCTRNYACHQQPIDWWRTQNLKPCITFARRISLWKGIYTTLSMIKWESPRPDKFMCSVVLLHTSNIYQCKLQYRLFSFHSCAILDWKFNKRLSL